ncbi:hypothetical protein GCM10023166_16020 [Paeniglutamicibacter cryotolerans]
MLHVLFLYAGSQGGPTIGPGAGGAPTRVGVCLTASNGHWNLSNSFFRDKASNIQMQWFMLGEWMSR